MRTNEPTVKSCKWCGLTSTEGGRRNRADQHATGRQERHRMPHEGGRIGQVFDRLGAKRACRRVGRRPAETPSRYRRCSACARSRSARRHRQRRLRTSRRPDRTPSPQLDRSRAACHSRHRRPYRANDRGARARRRTHSVPDEDRASPVRNGRHRSHRGRGAQGCRSEDSREGSGSRNSRPGCRPSWPFTSSVRPRHSASLTLSSAQ